MHQPISWQKKGREGSSEYGAISVARSGTAITISLKGRPIIEARRASADEIAAVEKLLSTRPTDAAICAKATACCEQVMPLLGSPCDVGRELGSPPRVHFCESFLRGVGKILEQRPDIAVPPTCKAP